jgi:hypothetical protein
MADSNEDTGPTQITTTTALLVLATIFLFLRFWARYFVTANYGLDDWLLVAGLVSAKQCMLPLPAGNPGEHGVDSL